MRADYKKYSHLCSVTGKTNYAVAKATGISQMSLSDWKNGRTSPKVDKLYVIAKYFGVRIEDLLSEDA